MKVNDFIQAYVPPTSSGIFLVFIIRDCKGRIVGEYDPMVPGNEWEGDNHNILQQRIMSWSISRDFQDMDTMQIWITV